MILIVSLQYTHAQTLEWAKQLDATDYVLPDDVVVDVGGNVYVVGLFEGTADFDPGPGVFNLTSAPLGEAFICKLDASGAFVWAKQFDGLWISMNIDDTDNIYIAGAFAATADLEPGQGVTNLVSAGSLDIFVIKLDSNGDLIWARSMGGVDQERPFAIAVDDSGNVYTTGYFEDTVDFDPGLGIYDLTPSGLRDVFISKLNTSGDFVWARNMGGPNVDYGIDIAVDGSGNVYTTGRFVGTVDFDPGPGASNLSPFGSGDIFISKLDNAGDFHWAKNLGGPDGESVGSIAVDAAGNVYTTGGFAGMADFDPGPGSSNLLSLGDGDAFISKLDPFGEFIWVKSLAGVQNVFGNHISVGPMGELYIAGQFEGAPDLDPGPGAVNLTSQGSNDMFFSKLDATGNFSWAFSIGGTGYSDNVQASVVDAAGIIYSVGNFEGTADLDPGPDTLNFTATGSIGAAGFVQKVNGNMVGLVENMFEGQIEVFPNPTRGELNIMLDRKYDRFSVRITDMAGRLISTQEVMNTNLIPVSIAGPAGCYSIQITSSEIMATINVLKQ